MSIQLFLLPDGRWSIECSHCGGSLGQPTDQAGADRIMEACGVPVVTATDNEAALAMAEQYGAGPFGVSLAADDLGSWAD